MSTVQRVMCAGQSPIGISIGVLTRCLGVLVRHVMCAGQSPIGISVEVLTRCLVSMVRTAPLLDLMDSVWVIA